MDPYTRIASKHTRGRLIPGLKADHIFLEKRPLNQATCRVPLGRMPRGQNVKSVLELDLHDRIP